MSEATLARISQDEHAELVELIGQVRTLRALAEAGVSYVDCNQGCQLEAADMRGLFGVIMDRAHETWVALDEFATEVAPEGAATGADHG